MAKSSRSSDTVKVCLRILGEIKVDDNVDTLDIDTTSKQVGCYKMTGATVAEFVKDSVTIRLLHLGMDVEAGVPKLRDLLGKELDTVDRVAEDDGLIDLQLGEKGVETVNFLSLLDVSVKLGDASEGEFLHQFD